MSGWYPAGVTDADIDGLSAAADEEAAIDAADRWLREHPEWWRHYLAASDRDLDTLLDMHRDDGGRLPDFWPLDLAEWLADERRAVLRAQRTT